MSVALKARHWRRPNGSVLPSSACCREPTWMRNCYNSFVILYTLIISSTLASLAKSIDGFLTVSLPPQPNSSSRHFRVDCSAVNHFKPFRLMWAYRYPHTSVASFQLQVRLWPVIRWTCRLFFGCRRGCCGGCCFSCASSFSLSASFAPCQRFGLSPFSLDCLLWPRYCFSGATGWPRDRLAQWADAHLGPFCQFFLLGLAFFFS